MNEQIKKKEELLDDDEPKILNEDEVEKIIGGVAAYGNAPDGTPWIPGQNH